MSEESGVRAAEAELPPPDVLGADALLEVADGVWVLPDRDRTPHVPNVGIVVGSRSTLVIESGIGIANGERVLAIARELGGGRPLFVTASHFHPEHGYGVQAFAGAATIIYSEAQRDELIEKQDFYVRKFSGLSPRLERALRGVHYVPPDIVYPDSAELDLGGVTARLEHVGPAHTRGDQTVYLAEQRILWTGDLVEERFFAIMPDGDTDALRWIVTLERLERLDPAVVVPGHGALGGGELITTVKRSLIDARDRVTALHEDGCELAEIVEAVAGELLAAHPDWGNREWVEPIVEHLHRQLAA
jgi:glyoxylase-like metal-dependent hydrolase (beta-lactamase superfamily II)